MEKKLRLSKTNKFISGTCGGIGSFFGVDPTLVRIAFVALFFVTSGLFMLLIYIALWAIIPSE